MLKGACHQIVSGENKYVKGTDGGDLSKVLLQQEGSDVPGKDQPHSLFADCLPDTAHF